MLRTILTLALGLALGGAAEIAAQVENLGGVRLRGFDEFNRVIDHRCTICHTRERVDAAILQKRDLQKIQQRMINQGAQLSEQDKKVLGTFWGSPIKQPPADLPSHPPR